MPTLWIDADACPVAARDVVLKAARRTGVRTVFVANHALPIKPSGSIEVKTVAQGFDVADDHIANHVSEGDFLVTSDIPLAASAVDKGCTVVNSRGERFTADNIRQKLSMRNFMDTMRDTLYAQEGLTGGQPTYGAKDKQHFANALNAWLTKHKV